MIFTPGDISTNFGVAADRPRKLVIPFQARGPTAAHYSPDLAPLRGSPSQAGFFCFTIALLITGLNPAMADGIRR